MRWLVLVVVNMCTKYEISMFNRSKDIEGIRKSPYWNDDPVA